MEKLPRAGKNWAASLRVITDGDNVGDVLAQKRHDILRLLPGDVDADFAHGLDGERIQPIRIDAGAEGLVLIAGGVTEIAFCHLAAR